MAQTLVIGIGHPDRGDDAVGRIVARRLSERAPRGVTVIDTGGDAAKLIDLFDGVDEVIVVDAALSGAAPGTIHRIDAAAGTLPKAMFAMSTHMMGLADSVELARALGQLPARCIVYAIEGATFELGRPLSPAVAAALDEVIARVEGEIAGVA